MKIAFDGQCLLDNHRTGVPWNAHNMILKLAKYPENKCVIQCFTMHCTKEQIRNLQVYKKMGCKIECCRWIRSALYMLIWVFVPLPYHIFFKEKADVTHFFNFMVPPGVHGKSVATIHDMAYMDYPQTVAVKTRNLLRLTVKSSSRRADHIVTVSQYSKQQIMKHLHVPAEKISVIPNAVDHSVFRPDYTEQEIQNMLNKYGIQRQYILYLGTIEPRKNLERLISAYAHLCKQNNNMPQLVLAGGKGWLCDGIYNKAEKLQLSGKVIFTGYVDQKDSAVLMCGALAFVFPSLYEGFGMPPLEAMACGTPVITSDASSLPEVVGDAGITVNPKDTKELCLAMKRILSDESLREKLGKEGYKRAQKFTWERSAALLMELYRKL